MPTSTTAATATPSSPSPFEAGANHSARVDARLAKLARGFRTPLESGLTVIAGHTGAGATRLGLDLVLATRLEFGPPLLAVSADSSAEHLACPTSAWEAPRDETYRHAATPQDLARVLYDQVEKAMNGWMPVPGTILIDALGNLHPAHEAARLIDALRTWDLEAIAAATGVSFRAHTGRAYRPVKLPAPTLVVTTSVRRDLVSGEHPTNPTAALTDLRGPSQLVAAADRVLFLQRPTGTRSAKVFCVKDRPGTPGIRSNGSVGTFHLDA